MRQAIETTKRGRGRPRKPPSPKFGVRYDWDRWFKQRSFTLVRGVDYWGRTDTMAQQVRNAADPKRLNAVISITIADDGGSLKVRVLSRGAKKCP